MREERGMVVPFLLPKEEEVEVLANVQSQATEGADQRAIWAGMKLVQVMVEIARNSRNQSEIRESTKETADPAKKAAESGD
jgi:hypothetical protein